MGAVTEVTVLKAFVPLMIPVVAIVIMNDSVITLPSMFVPVTTTAPVLTLAAVPPIVTLRVLGTSGSVKPELTVVATEADKLVEPKIAVAEPAATFFCVSVYPKVLEYSCL